MGPEFIVKAARHSRVASADISVLEGQIPYMLRGISDQELKEIIRTLARAADLDLSDERIEAVLPQFKSQMEWIETLKSFRLPLEAEPAIVFQPKRRAPKKKGSR